MLILVKFLFPFLIKKKFYVSQLSGIQINITNFGDLIYIISNGIDNFLEIKLRTGKWPYDPRFLNILINDWIDNNKLGIGDGWHSYTISLRVRSWILVFRICPDLLNQKIIDSLWKQISWLYSIKRII